MDETTEVETTDYATIVKEAAIKGAVTALASITVTYLATGLINKVKSRRDNVVETAATISE